MAMGRPKSTLVLDSELREQLESLANSRSLPAGLVRRAKIILLSASGKNVREIAPQLETSRNTVGLWRRGTFSSVKELVEKIDHYVQNSNRHAQPFVWTATADSIFAKVKRLCERIYGTEH